MINRQAPDPQEAGGSAARLSSAMYASMFADASALNSYFGNCRIVFVPSSYLCEGSVINEKRTRVAGTDNWSKLRSIFDLLALPGIVGTRGLTA
jgi:hypothetical protein